MKRRLAIDTSGYSHFRGGDVRVADLIQNAAEVYLPVIVLGELQAAFRGGSRQKDNALRLEEFLATSFVHLLPVNSDVARRYGHLVTSLRAAGIPIPTNDIWIAATVMECGAHLITFDSDFANISGLDVDILKPA